VQKGDNIKIDLREMEFEDVNWIQLVQMRSSGWLCEDGNEPLASMKGGELFTSEVPASRC
jgi:hypothetical protein